MQTEPTLQAIFDLLASQREAVEAYIEAALGEGPSIPEQLRVGLGHDELPLAPTPSEVIYTKDGLRLLRFEPSSRRLRTPVLLVYSLINRYYIVDFLPGRSLIGFLVDQGIPVYCIDWGTPGAEEADLCWDDYVNRYIHRCVRRALKDSGAERVALYGYCMGGILALAYGALHPDMLQCLVAQATPVDFEKGGLLAEWVQPSVFDVDALVDAHRNVPSEILEAAFRSMDPVGMYQKWENFFSNLDKPAFVETFLGIESWAADNVSFPGEVYRQYIKDCYQTNNFMKARMEIGGEVVDLSRITCPILTVLAEKDTIVPPASAEVLGQVVGSDDTEILRFEGGHIGISVSSRARRDIWPKVARWIMEKGSGTPT